MLFRQNGRITKNLVGQLSKMVGKWSENVRCPTVIIGSDSPLFFHKLAAPNIVHGLWPNFIKTNLRDSVFLLHFLMHIHVLMFCI